MISINLSSPSPKRQITPDESHQPTRRGANGPDPDANERPQWEGRIRISKDRRRDSVKQSRHSTRDREHLFHE